MALPIRRVKPVTTPINKTSFLRRREPEAPLLAADRPAFDGAARLLHDYPEEKKIMKPIQIHPFSVISGATGLGMIMYLTSMAQSITAVDDPLDAPGIISELKDHLTVEYLEDGQGGTVKTFRFSGVNLQIVNGLGATNGNPEDPQSSRATQTNGLGNLLIGYNEPRLLDDDRTGSHNLVVGSEHNYNQFGGIVVGERNSITGVYSSVCGGKNGVASGELSKVCGGDSNDAIGVESTVVGGHDGRASGLESLVAGGEDGRAMGNRSCVLGGEEGEACGRFSCVIGGIESLASGESSCVVGGEEGLASGEFSCVVGGSRNEASYIGACVLGGVRNTASGRGATITGGVTNSATGTNSAVSGGDDNLAQHFAATVSGGQSQVTTVDYEHLP